MREAEVQTGNSGFILGKADTSSGTLFKPCGVSRLALS
jgi:hypothetical protein